MKTITEKIITGKQLEDRIAHTDLEYVGGDEDVRFYKDFEFEYVLQPLIGKTERYKVVSVKVRE